MDIPEATPSTSHGPTTETLLPGGLGASHDVTGVWGESRMRVGGDRVVVDHTVYWLPQVSKDVSEVGLLFEYVEGGRFTQFLNFYEINYPQY